MDDTDKMKEALKAFIGVRLRNDYGWGAPAWNLIDCVLSLNRQYLKMVVPRVQRFRRRYPTVRSLGELHDLLQSEGAQDFLEHALDYRDPERARVLSDVCTYFVDTVGGDNASGEDANLASWASSVDASDYRNVGIKGFGLAGFQYFRMFCGVQTVKPDKYIINFVKQVLGRQVSDLKSVMFLEQASSALNLPLREVDAQIWVKRSGGAVVYGGRLEHGISS